MSTDAKRAEKGDTTAEDEVRGIIERARENDSEDIDMYERLVLSLASRVDDLEELVEKKTSSVRSTNKLGIKRMNERMDEVENKMDLLNTKKNINIDVASELSVMEMRLLQGHEFRRVDERRAATLALNYLDWASGSVGGSKLKAKEARKFLSDDEGVDLDPKLAHRAIDELVKQSGGKFFTAVEHGQKVLKLPKDTIWCPTEEKLLKASGEDI
jgi:hypothetical protein